MADQFTSGYALLIAVNENLVPQYALPTVARDAVALRDVLVHPERCAYPADNVRLLMGADASRDGIRGGLAWLKERIVADGRANATAVVFYSGHGAVNSDDNSYYLLPYDLRSPITDSLLRASDVAAAIEQVQPRRLLVVLDCCHAGGMNIKGMTSLARRGCASRPRRPRPGPSPPCRRGRGGRCSAPRRPPKAPTSAPTAR